MSTPFVAKSWQNSPTTSTPLSAAALIDLETRLSNFSRLNFVAVSGTHTAADGELSICSTGNYTVTLPAPSANGLNAVFANSVGSGAITIATPSGLIVTKGGSAASITLLSAGDNVGLASDGTNYYVISGQYGLTGSSIIATSEARTNVAYGTLTTPDQVVGIGLPTAGLIAVWYQATWHASASSNAGRAAIFIGSNQLEMALGTGPVTVAAVSQSTSGPPSQILASAGPFGLASPDPGGSTTYAGDITTGQSIGAAFSSQLSPGGFLLEYGGIAHDFSTSGGPAVPMGEPTYIFAAAGIYTISVQFKSTSGSVTVSNRRLYVQAIPF